MKPIASFWWKAQNFGDTLTPILFEAITGRSLQYVPREAKRKLVSVGSILHCVGPGDIVVGTGSNRNKILRLPGALILSVRGPLTRGLIYNHRDRVPENYGDPALILPRIYDPDIKPVKGRIGYLPHYVDKPIFTEMFMLGDNDINIDIQADWKTIIDQVKSCELIISSTLHGIIAAEAYGVPVKWIQPSQKIIGGTMKYQDYFLGTGRPQHDLGSLCQPMPDLPAIQDRIINTMHESIKLYDKLYYKN